ncbi:MAG: molybdenum cofactor guanylyltransferase [bacterium]|jgi:molybdopterin-guanine dinucleotide biosynthesis protein A
MAGIILAGGKGERLGGSQKALQQVAGKPLIQWVQECLQPLFSQLILVTNAPELYPYFPGLVVTDIHPHRGPLGGIEAGLEATTDEVNFVVGCDMPFLNRDIINYMHSFTGQYDLVIPRLGSYIEPLHAFYHKRTLTVIKAQLNVGIYKLSALLKAPLQVYYLNEALIKTFDPELCSFFNINTPTDLIRAEGILRKEAGINGFNHYTQYMQEQEG